MTYRNKPVEVIVQDSYFYFREEDGERRVPFAKEFCGSNYYYAVVVREPAGETHKLDFDVSGKRILTGLCRIMVVQNPEQLTQLAGQRRTAKKGPMPSSGLFISSK